MLLFLLNTTFRQSAVRNQKSKTAASKVTARLTTKTTSGRTATTATTETSTKATTQERQPRKLQHHPNTYTETIILEVQHRMEKQKRQRENEDESKSQGKIDSINHPIYLIRCITVVLLSYNGYITVVKDFIRFVGRIRTFESVPQKIFVFEKCFSLFVGQIRKFESVPQKKCILKIRLFIICWTELKVRIHPTI